MKLVSLVSRKFGDGEKPELVATRPAGSQSQLLFTKTRRARLLTAPTLEAGLRDLCQRRTVLPRMDVRKETRSFRTCSRERFCYCGNPAAHWSSKDPDDDPKPEPSAFMDIPFAMTTFLEIMGPAAGVTGSERRPMMLFRRNDFLLVARCEVAGHDKPSKAYNRGRWPAAARRWHLSSSIEIRRPRNVALHELVRLDGEIAHNAGDVLGLAEASPWQSRRLVLLPLTDQVAQQVGRDDARAESH